ncbi:Gfo/Idh/MocA family oxidoreductase [Parapedobacter sp. SGR-10]|uniref:Gfo/Idh/MocA family protein n=1 Tax=Parapedobacter sp. SGR-10 TaxID=2710879 RepID=UPI0013CF960E|nr:Gfo/Idh/MocA family oxidoreductase [Parapedobacter sp. SGR-10]NGF57956.1 Gfo/Idh/MocA family oxidoreductase [Parapedobacter sp. SGR-10]
MIKWGMIGAGDVTEVKSGPAFRKVEDSDLIAVMRRDEEKVKDYAARHGIANWYTDVEAMLANSDVNAVYIATPPHVHLHYVEKALQAGKMVYVEKPLALDAHEARQMKDLLKRYSGKLVVAHYRRANPYFLKVKEIVESGLIGQASLVHLNMYKKAQSAEELSISKNKWRIDPAISGGGLFHDLAPHQLDLMVAIFGSPLHYCGLSDVKGTEKPATRVSGQVLFDRGVLFHGIWDFDRTEEEDLCVILGSEGKLRFSFFEGKPIVLERGEDIDEFAFEPLQHVQQPMIEQTVRYFKGEVDNPCTIEDGILCMEIIDAFTK